MGERKRTQIRNLMREVRSAFRALGAMIEDPSIEEEEEAIALLGHHEGFRAPYALFMVHKEAGLAQLCLTLAGPLPRGEGDLGQKTVLEINLLGRPLLGHVEAVDSEENTFFLLYCWTIPLELLTPEAVPAAVERAVAEAGELSEVVDKVIDRIFPD